ncbi:hypothetical protein [Streptomyces mirabilis]|uniref:hypothetical protein n=1 Tax=Streptomyces mirabilis TaxID=68239 RepID=UPI00325129D7
MVKPVRRYATARLDRDQLLNGLELGERPEPGGFLSLDHPRREGVLGQDDLVEAKSVVDGRRANWVGFTNRSNPGSRPPTSNAR